VRIAAQTYNWVHADWVVLRAVSIVFALLFGLQGRAAAEPDVRLSIGAGISRVYGRSTLVPMELSLVTMPFFPAWSISLGLAASEENVSRAYLEASVLCLGAGVGYGSFQSASGLVEGPVFHLSVFVPIPIPVLSKEWDAHGDAWLLYLLPYYRPAWGPWPGTENEVGIMVKVGRLIHQGRCNSFPSSSSCSENR